MNVVPSTKREVPVPHCFRTHTHFEHDLAPGSRTVLIREHLANKHRFPCAEHVTWTRHYTMIRGRKALILIALRGPTDFGAICAIWRTKKPANVLTSRAFRLVAGERNPLYRTVLRRRR